MKRASDLRRAGFSLIELVLAIVVLGIGLPPIFFSLTEGAKDSVLAERQTVAAQLAAEKLEHIIADRHAASRGYSYLANANYAAESPVSGFTAFTRSVSISEVSASDLSTASGGSGFKKVVVTVSYSNPTGSYVLTCILCDN